MRTLLEPVDLSISSPALAGALASEPGLVFLHSGLKSGDSGRFSFLTARPFLTFTSRGSQCHVSSATWNGITFGNPWEMLERLMTRYEVLDEVDMPFPLGGCFGFWGYDLKHATEPRLARQTIDDLDLPDAWLGFHDSLVAFDHQLSRAWIISTGVREDGSRDEATARAAVEWWRDAIARAERGQRVVTSPSPGRPPGELTSNFSRAQFLAAVRRAQGYIREGHIYQVNLAQRFTWNQELAGWDLFQRLLDVSPAPYAAFINGGTFQLASSSPELFLRMSGPSILTRPIKGTRPRSSDPTRDAQLSYELQTSPKEMAELVMITDLLRNDLGRICEFGSVVVPELVRLERFAQVQHLVSTVAGRLRPEVTHAKALAASFPGGSITGAPKIRAMEIIEEIEPNTRGPYTGCCGYLGFNRESQLNITIRTALCLGGLVHYHAGAGIVADSIPEAEYEETLAKAAGFLGAVGWPGLDVARPIRTPQPD